MVPAKNLAGYPHKREVAKECQRLEDGNLPWHLTLPSIGGAIREVSALKVSSSLGNGHITRRVDCSFMISEPRQRAARA
jgi:hypothetical protein